MNSYDFPLQFYLIQFIKWHMQNSSNCHPNSPYILTIFYQLHIKEKSSGSRKPELFFVQLQGLEARDISHAIQKGKNTPLWLPCLLLVAS
jgi:hypothetical protein